MNPQRRALTLFELLLVLALLVILGALSMPALDATIKGARLRHSGDRLRAAWAKARLAALQSGTPHSFRCVWGTGQYSIQAENAWLPADAETELPSIGQADDEPNDLTGEFLPEGVTFYDGRWGTIEAAEEPRKYQWSKPLFFYPDGTASDAVAILENSDGNQLQFVLRGLTGVSLVKQEKEVL